MCAFIQKCVIIFKKPISYIIIFSIVLFSLGITWGLPHIETWCPDSLALLDPLLGLSQLFSFGCFNKYPLVHQVIFAIVNLPVVLAAAINSTDLHVAMIDTGYKQFRKKFDPVISVEAGGAYVQFPPSQSMFAGLNRASVSAGVASVNKSFESETTLAVGADHEWHDTNRGSISG